MNRIMKRYLASPEGKIQGRVGVTPLKPIDPDSDFGKLVIGGRITTKNSVHEDFYFQQKVKQANYLRFERNEWILIKKAAESEREKKRTALVEDGTELETEVYCTNDGNTCADTTSEQSSTKVLIPDTAAL